MVRSLLADIRILALEQHGAGPFGSMHLADLGAEVIKIEPPGSGGDIGRYVPPFSAGEDSLFFQSLNRNKKSLCLDLKKPAGRRVFEDLVRQSDAVYSNLRADVVDRLRIRYADLSSLNPAIVCCSLTGFGNVAGYRSRPGYDNLYQALAGWMALTGEPNAPPTKSALSLVDFAGGYMAAIGLLGALHSARQTGRGTDCDVSLFDTALSLLSYIATWHLSKGHAVQRRRNSAHFSLTPCQNFRTSDGWITIVCAKDKFFARLAAALDAPLADDVRFRTMEARRVHAEDLLLELEEILAQRTTADWLHRLEGAGVPCAPVNSVSQALSHPLVKDSDLIAETSHPVLGRVRQIRSPLRVAGRRLECRPAPRRNADAEAILVGLLGYGSENIYELTEGGVIGPGEGVSKPDKEEAAIAWDSGAPTASREFERMWTSTPSPPLALYAERATRIDAVGSEVLERLGRGRSFYSNASWLRSIEDLGVFEARHLIANDEQGRTLGVLPTYLARTPANPRYDPFRIFGQELTGSAVQEAWQPVLLGGVPAGYRNELLLDQRLAPRRREEVLRHLWAQFGQLADELGAGCAGLLYLTSDALRPLCDCLPEDVPVLLTGAECWLEVPSGSFDAYMGRLSSRRRSIVRRDLAAFADTKATIELRSLAESHRDLAPLLANLQRRYGSPVADDAVADRLRAQAACLDRFSVVFVCLHDGIPIGFSLGYQFGDAFYVRLCGFDYERTGPGAEYFNVVFYEPIRYALEHGLTTLHFGMESYRAKLLRGCRLEPLWSVVAAPENRVGAWRHRAAEWNMRQRARWSEELGSLVGGLTEERWTAPGPWAEV